LVFSEHFYLRWGAEIELTKERKMSHYIKTLSVLSAGALLGCSQFALAPSGGTFVAASVVGDTKFPKVQPVERITSPVSEVDGLFIMGRAAHGQGQMALAQERYAKVLSLQPKHVGALNAMAVIYAQSAHYESAIEFFRQALEVDASAAHVHNNFGYALMLAGRLDEAQIQLDQAQALNPLSELTRKNRALLAQSRGNIPVMAMQGKPETIPQPVAPEGSQLVAVKPHVFELRDARATAQVQKMPPPTLTLAMSAQGDHKALPSQSKPAERMSRVTLPSVSNASVLSLNDVKIEVSNGVGIRNLARRTAERLALMGVVTARLTNQPGYSQTKTEIFYSAGQMGAAQALSAKLPMAAQVLAANDLGTRVQMRLVLGRDLDVKALANWLDGLEAPVVAVNRFEGWLWS
jgi:LytR cell envelope-related transcriptional attenuator/Tetratricopeptide repeat